MSDLESLTPQPDDLSAFERKLVKSLKSIGNLLPETEDEITFFENCFQKEIKRFSSNLADADSILKTGRIDKQWTLKSDIDESVKDNLAQAAREGKELTDELKRKMLDDRNNSRKR